MASFLLLGEKMQKTVEAKSKTPKSRARKKIEDVVSWTVSAVTFIFILTPLLYCLLQGEVLSAASVEKIEIGGDKMIIQGTIRPYFARRVHEALAQPHEPIKTVLLTSIGGDEPSAESIKVDLHNIGPHRTVIPKGYSCQSACLDLVADPNTTFDPADDATLLFHRGWMRAGPRSCVGCRIVDWEYNNARDIFLGESSHREMFRWAETIFPTLGKALAACRPDPFNSLAGRTITGKQFKDFRDGHADALACPS